VREAEGTAALRPGESSNSTGSERPKNYIRNVEAVGSNPITSTKMNERKKVQFNGRKVEARRWRR
jgi:hypothetical protein